MPDPMPRHHLARRKANIVSKTTAKSQLSRLLARVERREEITITRDRCPVAKLIPIIRAPGKRRFGALRGKVTIDAAFFTPLLEKG